MKPLLVVVFAFMVSGFAGGAVAAAQHKVPDTLAERMKPCTICHGTEDKAGRDAYYPRIAGKPKGYLFNQLRNFRDGRRYYRPMLCSSPPRPTSTCWRWPTISQR